MTIARSFALVLVLTLPVSAAAQTAATPEKPAAPEKPQEKPPDKPADKAQEKPPADKPWWERLTFYGDFRGRYEGFFQQDIETRQRERFRFRIGVRTAIAEGLDFNFRLGSGDAADVTSTNQTLTDFWNRKPINIDQLSLAWTPQRAKALTLGFGKYGYPVTRTQMVWDDDVNWEGTYEQVSATRGPVSFRLVGVQSPINDVAADDDAFMFGQYGQIGFRVGGHAVQLSIADYAFKEADQIAVALDARTAIRTQNTNALRRNAERRVIGFQSGYNTVDTIAQVTFNTGRAQYPLIALADFVVNTKAANDDGSGLWLVGTYGRAATPKTFSTSYTFARVERDAVLSAYNFSDMGPATNVVMNMGTFSYMPKNRVNLDFIAILTKLLEVPMGARNPMLKRIQVDARVTF